MKRINQEGDADQDINAMANCLMLLSGSVNGVVVDGDSTRVFTCKTCSRQFPSFQALGGHRASHKKPRLMAVDHLLHPFSPPKPKIHECPICGLEFAIGQALGGHMRRHRATVDDQNRPPQRVPVVKKARVLFLDLNLTPLENKFVFGNIVPTVDCLF